jgi:hypothetical protein
MPKYWMFGSGQIHAASFAIYATAAKSYPLLNKLSDEKTVHGGFRMRQQVGLSPAATLTLLRGEPQRGRSTMTFDMSERMK